MWNQLKRSLWQWRGILITAPSVTVFVLLLRFAGLLELLEMAALDQLFQLRPREPVDTRIVIVDINESDIKRIGRLPFSDKIIADLIKKLKQHNPASIGLDIYRDVPVGEGYQEFLEVVKSTPNLIGVQKVGASIDSASVLPPPSLKQRGQVGANDFLLDPDGKVRRSIVYLDEPNGESLFSFSFKLAYDYLISKKIKVDQRQDLPIKVGDSTGFVVQLNKSLIPRFTANSGGYTRAEDEGYQTILNYRGSPQTFKTVSMADVLEGKISIDFIKDKIVLIGASAESLKDLFYTPFSSRLLRSNERMPGVIIHAHAISQFLSAATENRLFIQTWDEPLEWLWIMAWSILGAVLSWQQRSNGNVKRRVPWTIIGIIVAIASLLSGCYVAFLLGWWIPLVPAGLALVGSAASVTAYVARSAGEIRKAFGRFVTDEIVANLLENPEGLKLGGERRRITILTSDIRGFTAISERLPPEEVIKIINLYLGYMADVITQYQGTIDEFMGDGILVLFGAPTKREDDADRAIGCAIAMQLAMKPVNEKMLELGLPNLEMGIGINTGDVVVGNIGSEKRTKYGVVGNQVNLTYRIESYTVGGQIFVSESTLKQVSCDVVTDEEREVQPKGVHYPIKIYEVIGILGKYDLHLTKTEEVFYSLPEPIVVQYAVLQGKQVNRDLVTAKLIQISAREAEVYLETSNSLTPPALTNLKINLLPSGEDDFDDSDDIYAKVLEKPAGQNHFFIRFTNRPPKVEKYLNTLYESLSTGVGIKKEL